MSSFSGLNSQGKGDKKKYSQYNINEHYKGKGLETQKSTVAHQYGKLHSLGKVNSGLRRAPAPVNLPSLKSENSGNDPTINLVPSGPASSGWGSGTTTSATGAKGQQTTNQATDQQPSSLQSRQQPGLMSSSGSSGKDSQLMSGGQAAGVGTSSSNQPSNQQQTSGSSAAGGKPWTARGSIEGNRERPAPATGGKESMRYGRDFPTLDGAAAAGSSGPGGKHGAAGVRVDLRPSYGSWREGGGRNTTSDLQADPGSSSLGSRQADDTSSAPNAALNTDITGRDRDFRGIGSSGFTSGRPSPGLFSQTSSGSTHRMERDDPLFRRQNIVKDKDIDDLGKKAAVSRSNDDSSWATASGEIDFTEKLRFSDNEEEDTDDIAHAESASEISRDKPSSNKLSRDDAAAADVRDGKERQSDSGRASSNEKRSASNFSGQMHPPSREAWPAHGGPGYPPNYMMMSPQQRMQFEMWQRSVAAAGPPGADGRPGPPHMPPGPYMMPPYPPRMPMYPPGPMSRGGTHGVDDPDDDMWQMKQKKTHNEVNAALERAKSKRGEETASSDNTAAGGFDRRSRSTSESSNDQSVNRTTRYPDNNKKQIPPRFQQQRSSEGHQSADSSREEGGAGGRPPHPMHPGQAWPMGWPMPPPYMGMPPMSQRPRNNSRGSDDDRRTPDQPGSGPPSNFNPHQFYEMQMRHWFKVMTDYAKANPDVPMPPFPPFIGHPPARGPPGSSGGMMPPHMPPHGSLPPPGYHPERRDGKDGEEHKPERPEKEILTRKTSREDQKSASDQVRPSSRDSRDSRSAASSKVQEDPFIEEEAEDSKDKSAESKRSVERQHSQKGSNYSSYGSRDDRRDSNKRTGSNSRYNEDNRPPRHQKQQHQSGQSGKDRKDDDSTQVPKQLTDAANRKRRNEIAAPVPVVKEYLRDDQSRTSQMITLKKNSGSSKPSSSATAANSGSTAEPKDKTSETATADNKLEASSTRSENKKTPVAPSVSTTAADGPPKQSAWQTPVPPVQPVNLAEVQLNKPATTAATTIADKENTAPSSQPDSRQERSKVSPSYSDYDNPPVKRYREEPSARGRGGYSSSDRGSRRGGSRSREFVRGGGSSSSSRGARGGSYSTSRGVRGASTTRGASSGRGRGRGGYDHYSSREEFVVDKWDDSEPASKSYSKQQSTTSSEKRGSRDEQAAAADKSISSGADNKKKSSEKEIKCSSTPSADSSKPSTPTPDGKSATTTSATPAVIKDAPPPKENIWDKRKQELVSRDTPSPTAGAAQETESDSDKAKGTDATAVKESKQSSKGGDEKEVKGSKQSASTSKQGAGGNKSRPTRDTYVAPRARSRVSTAPRFNKSRNYYNSYDDGYYYDEDGYYYEDDDDGYYPSYSGGRGSYSRGRGRSSSNRGSSRGRYSSTSNTRSSSNAQKTEAGGDSDAVEVKIGQWNGPEEEGKDNKKSDSTSGEARGYGSGGYRGGSSRGRGKGTRFSTRGTSSRGSMSRHHQILPSAPHSPSKRRQDSTNTDNGELQEEWETASESSDHFKDSSAQEASPDKKSSDKKRSDGPAESQSNGGTSYRGGSRGGYSHHSERGGRGRGGLRGGATGSGYRGTGNRERYSKEGSPSEGKPSGSASGRRGAKSTPYTNGRTRGGKSDTAGNSTSAVYRLDEITLDNPAAVAALSNKNSDLSDVSKPLSGKDKPTVKNTSNNKDQMSSSTIGALDAYDLNNIAGVVIIDDLKSTQDDSDGWQDEDGFQEVVSRKTKKEKARQEHEAAAKAAAAAQLEIKQKEKLMNGKMGKKPHRSTSPSAAPSATSGSMPSGRNKTMLPPRLMKKREADKQSKHAAGSAAAVPGNMASSNQEFKIENWDVSAVSAPSAKPVSVIAEPPVQIDTWDQELAKTTPKLSVTKSGSSSVSNHTLGSPEVVEVQHSSAMRIGSGKPIDKHSELADSGIDVSHDKDTGSVRSSPDAGSNVSALRHSAMPLSSASQYTGSSSSSTSGAVGNFPSALSMSADSASSKTSSSTAHRQQVTSLASSTSSAVGGAVAGLKLDFTYDPDLEQAAASIASSNTDMGSLSSSGTKNLDSVKALWDSPGAGSRKPANQNTMFGTQSGDSFSSASEPFNKVDKFSASRVEDFSVPSNEGFPSSDGFQVKSGDNSAYPGASSSQSASNIFVANVPKSDHSSVGLSSGRQTQQQPQPSPRITNQMLAGHGVGVTSSSTTGATSSSHSGLDSSASVFTPSFRMPTSTIANNSSSASQISHSFGGFMMTQQQQQPQTDFQSYRSANSGLQQQQSTNFQPGMSSSQGYPGPAVSLVSSSISPLIKQTLPNATPSSSSFSNIYNAKVSPFDTGNMGSSVAVSSAHSQPAYLPTYDMLVGQSNQASNPAQHQQAFRLTQQPQQQAPQGQQVNSFFAGSSQAGGQLSFYPAAPTASLQQTASPFSVGLIQPNTQLQPTMLTSGPTLAMIGQSNQAATGWGQTAAQQNVAALSQQMKGYKPGPSAAIGNQLAAGQMNSMSQSYQMTSGGAAFTIGQPSSLADFGMTVGHLQAQPGQHQQATWGSTAPVGQPGDKSMLGNAASQMNLQQQQQKMGGMKLGSYQPAGPMAQGPRAPFHPGHGMPARPGGPGTQPIPPSLLTQMSAKHQSPGPAGPHRPHSAPHQYIQQGPPRHPGQHQQMHGGPAAGGMNQTANRYAVGPGPIQRPGQQNRQQRNNKMLQSAVQQHNKKIPSQQQAGSTNMPGPTTPQPNSSGNPKYTSTDEMKKARAEAIQAAKDFLNPEKKSATGSTSHSTSEHAASTSPNSSATESANSEVGATDYSPVEVSTASSEVVDKSEE